MAAHLGCSGRLGEGAGERRRLGEARGRTRACWGGLQRRRRHVGRPRVRQRSPARSWGLSCARNNGKKGSGECGVNGEYGGGVSGEREAAARRVRARRLPRARRCPEKNKGSSGLASAAPPSWRCTREGGVREWSWGGVWSKWGARGGFIARWPVHGGRGAGCGAGAR